MTMTTNVQEIENNSQTTSHLNNSDNSIRSRILQLYDEIVEDNNSGIIASLNNLAGSKNKELESSAIASDDDFITVENFDQTFTNWGNFSSWTAPSPK